MATARIKGSDTDTDATVAPVAVDDTSNSVTFGDLWNEATELEGADPVEKDALLGVPFVITGARFYRHKRSGASMVELEARYYPSGEIFGFQDSSSTGVRAQTIEYLVATGTTADPLAADDTTWFDMALKAPLGLRVSSYETEVQVKGKPGASVTQKARTYYIRPNGNRARRA
jgi:hypothetical protein